MNTKQFPRAFYEGQLRNRKLSFNHNVALLRTVRQSLLMSTIAPTQSWDITKHTGVQRYPRYHHCLLRNTCGLTTCKYNTYCAKTILSLVSSNFVSQCMVGYRFQLAADGFIVCASILETSFIPSQSALNPAMSRTFKSHLLIFVLCVHASKAGKLDFFNTFKYICNPQKHKVFYTTYFQRFKQSYIFICFKCKLNRIKISLFFYCLSDVILWNKQFFIIWKS